MVDEFHTICICGSMRFYELMLRFAEYFTSGGFIVLMPFATKQDIENKNDDSKSSLEGMLDRMHKVKIDRSTFILVVTGEIGENYIGESTASEIAYAQENNKPIVYSNDVLDGLKLSTTILDAL